ncbi:aspartic peptidase domain-containing protein [Sporodiniella umbellata]|nr:aspartic peptidase domain-containing protein [Sporodiniella umbellata]
MKSTYLLLFASLLLTANTKTVRVPLYRRHINFISASAKELKNGMLGGHFQIGNPPQNFTLAFDTTTGFTWVRGKECNGKNCLGREAYNARNSTSAISTSHTFKMKYGASKVSTKIYLDTFQYSGLEVDHLPFGSAYCMKGFDEGFDGFIGLGRSVDLNRKQIGYSKRDIPALGFVPAAYQQGSGIGSSQFGMYTTSGGSGFTQDSVQINASNTGFQSTVTVVSTTTVLSSIKAAAVSTAAPSVALNPSIGIASGGWGSLKRRTVEEEPAGYLILGGIDDEAIQGRLYYTRVAEENDYGHWAVPVYEAKFVHDLYFHVKRHAKAIISTSTDIIGLPDQQADEFKKHWYAEYDTIDNTYLIPCCLMSRLKSFQIQLGSLTVTLPPSYWSHPQATDTCCKMCRTHIGRSGSECDFTLGHSFTNAFYTQFDDENDRIGLAIKRNHIHDGLELWQE